MFVQAILGPMGSGKTSELLRLANLPNAETIVIKHANDDSRYGSGLRTHDGFFVNALSLNKLVSSEVFCSVRAAIQRSFETNYSVRVLVDEVQFFSAEDVSNFIKLFENSFVEMYFAGLESDCFRNPFPATAALTVLSDDVRRLSGSCAKCFLPNTSRFTRLKRGFSAEVNDFKVGVYCKCFFLR